MRKNNLTAEGVRLVMEQVTQIEGITKVEGPPQLTDEIRASSGNQLRMTVPRGHGIWPRSVPEMNGVHGGTHPTVEVSRSLSGSRPLRRKAPGRRWRSTRT